MIILIEEEHKTLECQETTKVDVESISKNAYVDQYMKLLIRHFFRKNPPEYLDLCKSPSVG